MGWRIADASYALSTGRSPTARATRSIYALVRRIYTEGAGASE